MGRTKKNEWEVYLPAYSIYVRELTLSLLSLYQVEADAVVFKICTVNVTYTVCGRLNRLFDAVTDSPAANDNRY